ncbi:GGDEF domain-containing protein [Burkholderia sp. Ac-20379]|uniref:GGDEF domain-containing protein n=1 Tax=Burkholderia sp. Ac-20379 TaxID=2703900 RepID=UPI00197D8328|nr:GGDEF domain-containing protein [Burkholderia sp. Ac-20379]MBN3725939.1 GGDEF domain-containing protein [Burkholderia sp. Ac-20379]
MHVDLLTLYFLAIGTLFASAGLTFWEHASHPKRSKALRILATGYATLGAGCVIVLARAALPGMLGPAVSNLTLLGGYLLVLGGVAALSGRNAMRFSIGLLLFDALAWAIVGTRWPQAMWLYISAGPIALACAMTAFELLRSVSLQALQARRIAIVVTGLHALLYALRMVLLPLLAERYGAPLVLLASQITMYEGVLYSVILPMTLLRLVREETHSRLLREAQTDYLTRLGNRRWFFEEGALAIRRANGKQPFAVLALDLDQFKRINDHFGHKAGDDVLKSFATVARAVLGPDAILARIGGEEFAVLLSGYDAARADDLGDFVAQRFAATVTVKRDGTPIQATVSVGLARYEQNIPSLGDMLAAADTALYTAKSLGGNRLVRAA